MDLIQDSSTYQAISVMAASKKYRYIIFNMHLMFNLDRIEIYISIVSSFIQIQRIWYSIHPYKCRRNLT